MRRVALVVLAVATSAALFTPAARAATIWDGDASRGTGVFGHIGSNCSPQGSVTAVTDATQGRVWRYHKPSGSNRCESRGVKAGSSQYRFQNGSTYYLGWRSKLSSTVNNNATFQWKSFGNHTQNYPVVLKVIDGQLSMLQRQPGGPERIIWRKPVSAGAWNSIVIGLHLSSATRGGWIELWYNGARQTFTDGTQRHACRTFDSENHPKWGVYGASGTTVTNLVDALKIGTAYSDVAP